MENFEEYFKSLGALHDAVISKLLWLPEKKRLEFDVEDLHCGIDNSADVIEKVPGIIVLYDVAELLFTIEFKSVKLHVYEFSALKDDCGWINTNVFFWPSGNISVKCKNLEVVQVSSRD